MARAWLGWGWGGHLAQDEGGKVGRTGAQGPGGPWRTSEFLGKIHEFLGKTNDVLCFTFFE